MIGQHKSSIQRRATALHHSTKSSIIPSAQFHITSKAASNSPSSQCCWSLSDFSVRLNLSTSFTVTNPFREPSSSTRMTRGLYQNSIERQSAQTLELTHPMRLKSCITISRGKRRDTVRGVYGIILIDEIATRISKRGAYLVHPGPQL